MEEQKDIQKTGVNLYGQKDSLGFKSLVSMPFSDYPEKKTRKLVTALYMVTDCMEVDDPIKTKLRFLGVELMSDTYVLSLLPPTEKQARIRTSRMYIEEVISLIEIGCAIGFISEMNTAILKREFTALDDEFKSYQSPDSHFTFTLDEEFLMVERADPKAGRVIPHIKDNLQLRNKEDRSMSFTKTQPAKIAPIIKKTYPISNLPIDKNIRTQKILSFIKDKHNASGTNEGLSIKDISSAFSECSEKTIQRELNNLVFEGKIKRIGAKRWSRYQSL